MIDGVWQKIRINTFLLLNSIKKSNIKKIDTTDKKNLHKTVKFKDDEISLDSLDSSDHVGSVSNNDDNDSKSCDTLDI